MWKADCEMACDIILTQEATQDVFYRRTRELSDVRPCVFLSPELVGIRAERVSE